MPVSATPAGAKAVFISHAAADDGLADKLSLRLKRDDLAPWVDHVDIRPGDDWDARINLALAGCQGACFLLTANSETSRECAAEWRTILTLKKRLYVALSGAIEHFPYRLRLMQYVDLNVDQDAGLQILCEAIRNDISPGESIGARRNPALVDSLLPAKTRLLKRVRLVLDMAIGLFKLLADRFVRVIARLLGVSYQDIEVVRVSTGSTVVDLRMRAEAAQLLVDVVREEPEILSEFRLVSASILGSALTATGPATQDVENASSSATMSATGSLLPTGMLSPLQLDQALESAIRSPGLSAFSVGLASILGRFGHSGVGTVAARSLFQKISINPLMTGHELRTELFKLDPALRDLFKSGA